MTTDSTIRVRLQPLDAVPGDFAGNARRVLDAARRADADGIDALAVPAESIAPAPATRLGVPSPWPGRHASEIAAATGWLLRELPPRLLLAGPVPTPPAWPAALALDASTVPFSLAPAPADAPGRILLRVNLHGAFDGLVCPGEASATAPDGAPVAANRPFSGDPLDLAVSASSLSPSILPLDPASAASSAPPPPPEALLWDALVLAIRGYVEKNRFPGAFVSLSGGIDSALVAALAVDALGPSRVLAATFPSGFTSTETLSDARELARRLGIPCPVVPIGRAYDLLMSELPSPDVFPAAPPLPGTLVSENLQARIRGLFTMALSNRHGHLVLATGNRSEGLTGYCTLYGDTCGGFAPLRDVYKTEVFALARHRNARTPSAPPIPQTTIDRPPSAELRPGQKDSDSLPPYPLLDALLRALAEDGLAPDAAARRAGAPLATAQRVARLLARSEFKRRQTPPGPVLRPPVRLPLTAFPC